MLNWLRRFLSRRPAPSPMMEVTGSESVDVSALIAEASQALRDGNDSDAIAALRAAIAVRHDDARLHLMLGTILERCGQLEDANDSYLLATCYAPVPAEAYYRLGIVASKLRKPEEAISRFRDAIAIRQDYPKAWNYLGKVLLELHRPEEAEEAFQQAVRFDPHYARPWSNLAYVSFELRSNFDLALECANKAIALSPEYVEARSNRAMVLQALGRCEEALAECDTALAIDPDHSRTRVYRAFAHLMLGDLARGWEDYEARLRTYRCFEYRLFDYPDWEGGPLEGKTVLIYAEQGLGDEMMFASCFGEVLKRANHCVIDCSPKLEKLFRRSFPGATIHGGEQVDRDLSWLERVPKIDCKVASGSLPMHFRRDAGSFPRHGGYLCADADRVRFWRARLDDLGEGLKVGLSWRGGMKFTHQGVRSLSLDQLKPLLEMKGVKFVSVQYGDCVDDLERWRRESGLEIAHWQEALDDYDETAALVSALDLVISVQTAVVHLGGALGRAVWVLVPAAPEWRYNRTGNTMLWYPAVTIFRQRELGQWSAVVSEVRNRLESRIAC